jgi:phenylacetate-CoA ligase
VTGDPLPDGERGELVFTTLTKEGMPVIRYRTRDLTCLLPGSARTMRRMEKITGRSDDMMIVRGVNVFPTQLEEQILKVANLAPHYQIVLTREDRLDHMQVLVEAAADATSEEARARAADTLRDHIKGSIGVSAVVSVALPNGIERSQGKARRVIDKRPKD